MDEINSFNYYYNFPGEGNLEHESVVHFMRWGGLEFVSGLL